MVWDVRGGGAKFFKGGYNKLYVLAVVKDTEADKYHNII